MDFPGGVSGKEPACQWRSHKRPRFNSWVRKIHWRRDRLPTLVLLPGKPHEKRSLVGYSSLGHKRIRHNLETKATTMPYFNVPPLAGLCRYCKFYELKVRGNPVSNKSTGMKRHFMSLCNILIILTFQPLSLLFYCSIVSDSL